MSELRILTHLIGSYPPTVIQYVQFQNANSCILKTTLTGFDHQSQTANIPIIQSSPFQFSVMSVVVVLMSRDFSCSISSLMTILCFWVDDLIWYRSLKSILGTMMRLMLGFLKVARAMSWSNVRKNSSLHPSRVVSGKNMAIGTKEALVSRIFHS